MPRPSFFFLVLRSATALIALLCLLLCLVASAEASSADSAATIPKVDTDAALRVLFEGAWAGQWAYDRPFDTWKLQFGHRKGAFESNIHINFIGDPLLQFMRDAIGIPDDNGFLVPFLVHAFIRAGVARPDVAPLNDTRIRMALESVMAGIDPAPLRRGTHKDGGDQGAAAQVPVFGFWPWKCSADNTTCRQYAINMNPLMDNAIIIADIVNLFVNASGKEAWVDYVADQIRELCEQFSATFDIPPDADDTGMNIGIAYFVERHAAELPSAAAAWRAKAFDYNAAANRILSYSYCPASTNRSRSSIDPRSYFWARDFFNNLTDPEDCIVTTWLQSYDEEVRVYADKSDHYLMPFNVNNVDPTVSTNALFGLNTMLLRGDTAWFTESEANRKAYMTTAKFLAWTVGRQPAIERPDLETLYYPNTMDMLAFTGRHLRLLREVAHSGAAPWPVPEMQAVYELLAQAFTNGALPFILSKALRGPDACGLPASSIPSSGNSSSSPSFDPLSIRCVDGFLGASDVDWAGKPAPRYLDRFFTTASAANAVLAAFVVDDAASGDLYWSRDTPGEAISFVEGAVAYLTLAALQKETSYVSAFFSGSVHTVTTLPFFYPATTILLMNDTSRVVNCSSAAIPFGDSTFQAVEGQVPEAEYQHLLQAGCAGVPTMSNYTGLNAADSPWPYWSSTCLSKALGLMAIAEFSVIRAAPAPITDPSVGTQRDPTHLGAIGGGASQLHGFGDRI